jgi:hypothetical protein
MSNRYTKNIKHLHASALSLVIAAATLAIAAWPSSCSKGPANQGVSEISSRARPKGGLKGFQAIDDQLSQSIAASGPTTNNNVQAGNILGSHLPAGVTRQSAAELLGTPGPVNMFLWTLVLRSLAGELALLCEDTGNSDRVAAKYLPEFRNDLKRWCTTKSSESFDAVWVWIQGFESETERLEVAKSIAPHLGTLSTADVLFVIMMNPHFLLEK